MKLEASHVLVTPTSFGRNDPSLINTLENRVGQVTYNEAGRPLRSEELVEKLTDVDGYIAGLDEINREALKATDRLKVIARYGVGVDNVDLQTAEEMGIIVTNTPGANAASVAELTIALILSLARHLVEAVNMTRHGKWPRFNGRTLEDKTVGLIGFGNVGKQVARRLLNFDCDVLAYDIAPDVAYAENYGVQLLSRDAVISGSDFLSLHCSLVPETKGMVDASFLEKMKTGAALINTARGELIDEEALSNALDREKLSGAALDVFSDQPPDPNRPLLGDDKVLVTPHMGGHTDGATKAMGWGALENCLAVLEGREPVNRIV